MHYINIICLPLYLKVLSISYMPKPNYTWNTNGKAEQQKYPSLPLLLVHKAGSPNRGDLRAIKCCSTAQASEIQTRKYFSGSKNGTRSKYLVCHQPCQVLTGICASWKHAISRRGHSEKNQFQLLSCATILSLYMLATEEAAQREYTERAWEIHTCPGSTKVFPFITAHH